MKVFGGFFGRKVYVSPYELYEQVLIMRLSKQYVDWNGSLERWEVVGGGRECENDEKL